MPRQKSAPRVGFEPTVWGLTIPRVTITPPRNHNKLKIKSYNPNLNLRLTEIDKISSFSILLASSISRAPEFFQEPGLQSDGFSPE